MDQNEFYRQLGLRIRAARRRANRTQLDLARQLYISRSTLAGIESGRQRVPAHILFDLCSVLGISPSELFPSPNPGAAVAAADHAHARIDFGADSGLAPYREWLSKITEEGVLDDQPEEDPELSTRAPREVQNRESSGPR